MEYEPLDLTPLCNAGVELYEPGRYTSGGTFLEARPGRPPIGAQTFRGLPFQVGGSPPDESRCLMGFGGDPGLYQRPVAIPVGRTARYVLFAHAVLETRLWEGGPLGVEVARYAFCYDDGEALTVPIRERFEIGNVPVPWGQHPFLCAPDQQDYLEPRNEGRWGRAGLRLTELGHGVPQGYYLWVWQNPRPDRPLRRIEVAPAGQTFVVAAVTLSQAEEYPLVRQGRRPIKITLAREEQAARPFDLEVAVDRGVATYAYPLADGPLDAPEMSGFGAPANPKSSPAYAEVAALPSATVTVRQGGAPLGQVRWGDLEAQGRVETPGVRVEIVDPGKNWVRVTVLDEATGQPVPCRIAFHSPAGVPYPPHGHHAPVFSNLDTWNVDVGGDVRLGQITYACIDGTCQGWLPRGRVLVDAARGFEYEPLRAWVTIAPGQQELTLRLKRWIDMNAQGYYSGDTHVHFLSAQGAQREAQCEDLNVVNLLLSQWGHLFTNTEEFTGRPQVSPDGRTVVHASQENRQHFLGHLSLLGLKQPVMPWGSGGPSEAEMGGTLEITMSEWADAAHAQGATVILPHFPAPNGETAALVATGRADAVEMINFFPYEHAEYYRYLNAGFRLPLVGGTDKMTSEVPVGLYRTYVQLPPDQEFTYDNWRQALHAGNTFLSGGPLLWLTVEGRPPGSEIRVRGGGTVEVQAEAQSIFPIHTLQIVQGGQVAAETTDPQGSRRLQLSARLKIESDTWLAARCAGPNYTARPHFDVDRRSAAAHTSPVYLTCGDGYALANPDALHYMVTLVSGSLAYLRQVSPQYPDGHVTHHHGANDHLGHLERPFHEALAALRRRLGDEA